MREADLGRLTLAEAREVIRDAWLAQAPPRRRRAWLHDHGLEKA
ncbi:hypothetical protein [Litorihabitans aurantiacus]|nr:hypothetical protein [Litorihabitans aurantiacus]